MKIPDNVMVVALGKSTYARCGLVANVTPLEPGWEGHVTLEFSNTTPLPAKMYAFEGCVQLLFFEASAPKSLTRPGRKISGPARRHPAQAVISSGLNLPNFNF